MSSRNFMPFFSKVIIIVLLLIIILAIVGIGKQITKTLQASKRLDSTANNLSKLQTENRKLQRELSKVEQSEFIEKIARDKLLMAKPNETIIIIPQNELKVLGETKKEVEVKLPNWLEWWKLFFK